MKKTATEIFLDFFKDRFGSLMSKSLLKQYLQRKNVSNFETLSLDKKISFGQEIIENMYLRFYNAEKVQNLKILYLLRFSMNEAVEKLESMIKKDSSVKIEPLTEIHISELSSISDEIVDEKTVKVSFECSKLLDGVLMSIMEQKDVVNFATTMMKAMMGMDPPNNELDDLKISAIYEFFNILLPAFIKVIADAYDTELYFTPIYIDDFKKKYYTDLGELKIPKKIMRTTIHITVDGTNLPCNMIFLIQNSNSGFNELMKQGGATYSDPFEQYPPKLLVQKTGDLRHDVEKLFGLLSLRPWEIDNILSKINRPKLSSLNYQDYTLFVSTLISDFYEYSSDNKKATIRTNMNYIFGYGS
jgi:chemotaxis protein CheY-P-specific phosphatase CheC